MLSRLLQVAAVAILLAAGSTTVEAKAVPIPCSGDRFVPVAAPAANALFAGKNMQLAYRFSGCSGAGFVAYDGNSRYMTLPPAVVSELTKTEQVTAPGVFTSLFRAPGQFWVEWLYLVLGVGFGIAVVRNKAAAASVSSSDAAEPAPVASARVAAQPAPRQTAPNQPAPRPAATARAPRAFGTAGGKAPATFGARRPA